MLCSGAASRFSGLGRTISATERIRTLTTLSSLGNILGKWSGLSRSLPLCVTQCTNDLLSLQQHSQQQVRFRSNRSRRGLYDGKDIRTGNKVSFSNKKTKRKFRPNVFKKRVYSEVLDEMVRFHITAAALRSIDKAGGLDNYLLTSKHVTEGEGLKAKNRIKQKMTHMAKMEKAAKIKDSVVEEEGKGTSAEESN